MESSEINAPSYTKCFHFEVRKRENANKTTSLQILESPRLNLKAPTGQKKKAHNSPGEDRNAETHEQHTESVRNQWTPEN